MVEISVLGSAVWTLGPDLVAYATLAGEQMPLADPETLTPLMRAVPVGRRPVALADDDR